MEVHCRISIIDKRLVTFMLQGNYAFPFSCLPSTDYYLLPTVYFSSVYFYQVDIFVPFALIWIGFMFKLYRRNNWIRAECTYTAKTPSRSG